MLCLDPYIQEKLFVEGKKQKKQTNKKKHVSTYL